HPSVMALEVRTRVGAALEGVPVSPAITDASQYFSDCDAESNAQRPPERSKAIPPMPSSLPPVEMFVPDKLFTTVAAPPASRLASVIALIVEPFASQKFSS